MSLLISKPVLKVCTLDNGKEITTYEIIISNLSSSPAHEGMQYSDSFAAGGFHWVLGIRDKRGLFLHYHESNSDDVYIEFTLTTLNRKESSDNGYGYPKLLQAWETKDIIKASVEFHKVEKIEKVIEKYQQFVKASSLLPFDNPLFSDVCFRCSTDSTDDQRLIHCSKLLLAGRSPYFTTLLNGSFKEKSLGSTEDPIIVKDTSYDALYYVLKYIHVLDESASSTLFSSISFLKEAYTLTEMYELPDLQAILKTKFVPTAVNFGEMFEYADTHALTSVVERILIFAQGPGRKDLFDSEGFEYINGDGKRELRKKIFKLLIFPNDEKEEGTEKKRKVQDN
eukprot:Awhi_evm1s48